MWKKIILVVVFLLIASVVGLTFYVNSIDWNLHKDKISQQFSQATGKEVVFKGKVLFNIFPSPYLEASNIEVYSDNSEDKVMLVNIKKLVAQLSIKSLIFGSTFNVEKMNILEPQVFFVFDDKGQLNWQSDVAVQEKINLENVSVSLDSLIVENARVNIVASNYNVSSTLKNLNAEIIADALFGPYRIEGSYEKNGSPCGFAVSLGSFAGAFATSINAVMSHPQSESYVRFDGTGLLKNYALNGNLVFESTNPINFINSNFNGMNLSEKYEYPTAVSLDVKTDKQEVGLFNIVVKYGKTAGSGNMLIPRQEVAIGEDVSNRTKVDVAFNMTELELEPFVDLLQDFIAKYEGKEYIPEHDFDIIGDVKALKTTYKLGTIRDLDFSFDYMNNVFDVRNFSAVLPEDTNFKASGKIESVEKELNYNFATSANTNNFAKVAKWLNFDLKPVSDNVFKVASVNTVVSGTLDTVKLEPFSLVVDNIASSGRLGIVRGDNTSFFAILSSDRIDFDKYVPKMPEDAVMPQLHNKVSHYFAKLGGLNNLNLQYRYNLAGGKFAGIDFGTLESEGKLKNGILTLDYLNVNDFADSDLVLKGDVSGFGKTLSLANVDYDFITQDIAGFVSKFYPPNTKTGLEKFSSFESKGIINGTLAQFVIKSASKLDDAKLVYNGLIKSQNGIYNFAGKMGVDVPDFVKFVNRLGVVYSPKYPLGLLKASAELKGHLDAMVLKNIMANVGANSFSGSMLYKKQGERNILEADLKANKFELQKFFYASEEDPALNFMSKENEAIFIARPSLNSGKINYDWLNNWDMQARLNVADLALNNYSLKNAMLNILLSDNILKISKLTGEVGNGFVDGNLELNIPLDAKVSGLINFKEVDINKDIWSGRGYGFTAGKATGSFNFITQATSQEAFVNDVSGLLKFDVTNPVFKGWNIEAIAMDLETRDVANGLKGVVEQNLSSGITGFNRFGGEAKITNGAFLLDAVFNKKETIVDVASEGNLKTWTASSAMKIMFPAGAKVESVSFSLDGDINAPMLSVDVSEAEKVYDSYWEEVAKEAKAKEQAKLEKYRLQMEDIQDQADDFANEIDNVLLVNLKYQSSLTQDEGVKEDYQDVEALINEAKALVLKVQAQAKVVNITDELIAELNKENDDVSKKIVSIELALKRTHARDVKLRVNQSYNNIYSAYNESKPLMPEWMNFYRESNQRLAATDSKYLVEADEKIAEWKKQFEAMLLKIDEINGLVANENSQIQTTSDVEVLERVSANFVVDYQSISYELARAKALLSNMKEYLAEVVKKEEDAYAQKLREAEVERKIEENIGQISTSSGKTVEIIRNLDDIERVEEEVENDEVVVLDFSEDNKIKDGKLNIIALPEGREATTVSGSVLRR